MQKGKIELTQKDAENTPAGGVVVGKRDGQTMIYDDASLGGYFVGKLHKDGGIKMVNKSTGQPLEVQGAEVIITAPAVNDPTKHNFNGQKMTNREILSKINSDGGGVSFADGGDIPAKINTTEKEYEYGGKMVHDSDIAHSLGMNSTLKKGKQHFTSGDTTYDVDAIYNAIKKGKIRLKTKEVETFPMKYPVYDKKYSETVKTDFRKPNGITVRTESGEEVLIDGNHRMNNAYLKGKKTMKTYYIEDPKQIAKFSKKNKFELGGENKKADVSDWERESSTVNGDYGVKAKIVSSKEFDNIYGNYAVYFFKNYDNKGGKQEVLENRHGFKTYDEALDYAKKNVNKFKDGGHLSSGKSLKQIAEMHNVSLAHINEQLAKGLEVEKEHFADFKERTRVAKDHLVENPNYYSILEKAGLKRGGKIEKENLVKDAKSGNTPARDLNNYNDLLDVQADGAVGGDSGIFANGGQVSNFFKKTYGNLVEKKGIITTKNDWLNKDGVKVLEYGFDPYRHEKSNTLFYYSWDYDDSGMEYDDFRNQLVDFFEKTYKKDVSELKALYVGWDRKEKDTYANGGGIDNVKRYSPYPNSMDNNENGDWVMYRDIEDFGTISDSDRFAYVGNGRMMPTLNGDWVLYSKISYAKGGVVYNTTKPKIEKVTIKETKYGGVQQRASVIGRNASTVSELQQIVSDYIGTSPKEDVDWIKFYVNDGTKGGYYIDLNKGKKNTVKNVNPETLNSLNFKRVIDAKTSLVRNYDWTDFFEGSAGKNKAQVTSANKKPLTKQELFYSKIWIGDDVNLKKRIIQKLEEIGIPFDKNNGNPDANESIDINIYDFDFVVYKESKEEFDRDTRKKEIFPSDLGIDVTTMGVTTTTPNASTSAKPFDLTSTKIWIDDNPELSKAIQEKAFELGWEWGSGKEVRATFKKALFFNYDKIIVTDNLSDTKIRFNERNTDFSEIFPSDLGIDVNNLGASASQTPTPTTSAYKADTEVQSVLIKYGNGSEYTALNEESLLSMLQDIWDSNGKTVRTVQIQPQGRISSLSIFKIVDLIENPLNSYEINPDKITLDEFRDKLSKGKDWYNELDWSDFFKNQNQTSDKEVSKIKLVYDTGTLREITCNNGSELLDAYKLIEEQAEGGSLEVKVTLSGNYNGGQFFETQGISQEVGQGGFEPSQIYSFEEFEEFFKNLYSAFNFDNFFGGVTVPNSGSATTSTTVNNPNSIEPYDAYRITLIWKDNSGKEIIDSMDIFNGVSGAFFISRLKEIEEQSQGKDVDVIIRAFANDNDGNQFEKNDYFTIGDYGFKPSTRTNEQIKSVTEEWIDGVNFDKYFADVIPLGGSQNINFKLDPNEVGLVTLTYKDKNGTDAQTFSYKGSDFITELEKIETDGQGVGIEVDVKVYSTDAYGKTFNRNLYITVGGNNFRPIGKTPEVIKFSIGSWFQGLNFDKFFGGLVPFNINTSASQTFDLSKTKIKVDADRNLSKKIQEKAFELGWGWGSEILKDVQSTGADSLFFNENKQIEAYYSEVSFKEAVDFREITADELFGNQATVSTSAQYKPINLSQTKIWIGNDVDVNKQIQDRAFELGWSWKNYTPPKEPHFSYERALYFDRLNDITYGNDRQLFDSNTDFREITFKELFDKIESAQITQTPTVNGSSGSVQEINDLKEAVGVLEGIASQASQKYNTKKYEENLELLKEVKEEYSLALSFTPESSFMYERIELMKKIAEIQKEITRITELKNGGAFYILSKVVDRLERGENWKELGNGQIMINEVPQQEIDTVIYTEKFKNWFGDWEQALITKEYDYVSKAITESGKPCVMYHGAKRIKYSYRQVSNGVVYLAENRSYAEWFSATDSPYQKQGDYLTQCFVNLKNPIDLTPFGVEEVDLRDIIQFIDALYPLAKIYDILPPNTAMAIMNNQLIGRNFRAWYVIRQFPELNKHIRDNTTYDGFIYYENNPSDMIVSEITGEMVENVTKATAVFNSNQVKLVDAMLFDSSLDDWRFETGGKVN